MITENLSTLKIHKLTKEQYRRELAAGRINNNDFYLTPDQEIDLTNLDGVLPITKGGTGATSASAARTNLGITSGTDLPSSGSDGQIFLLTGEGSYVDRIGAAPAGYGLGEQVYYTNILSLAALDTLYTTCFFAVQETSVVTVNGVNFASALGRNLAFMDGRVYQELMMLGSTCKLVRSCFNGTWDAWECENPPMASGVEYRTTERLDGKPVYVKYINYGYYTGGTALELAHNISNVYTPISIDLANNKQEVLTDYQNLEYVTMNRTYIYMKCGNSMGDVDFIVKYSKNES